MRPKSPATGRGFLDSLLATSAVVGSAVPVLHEDMQPAHDAICGLHHNVSTLTSLGDARVAITAKMVFAIMALVIVVLRVKNRRAASFLQSLASAPLMRTSLMSAAIIGIGLSAFDICTAYHGASVDVTGSCHCWLTGILTAIGAASVFVLLASGRALHAAIRNAVRTLVACFIWVIRLVVHSSVRIVADVETIPVSLFDSRRLHGRRGPPLFLIS